MSIPEMAPKAHPANAVFALMEDRDFRFSVIKPALEERKEALARMATGRYQLKGFRKIAKAPLSMLLPVISDEANVSAELAEAILRHWFKENSDLQAKVTARLGELGYNAKIDPFDDQAMIGWEAMKPEDAETQYEGTFLPDEDENAVMLMSLMLGWFGSEDGEEE